MRKNILINGQIYHIFTKSIAGFKVFNNDPDFLRIIELICYYQVEKPLVRFSRSAYADLPPTRWTECPPRRWHDRGDEKLVEIIAYCIMPTHVHLILKQLKEKGISNYMSKLLNSYTRYFNTKYKRKGPLWEGRFKNVLVDNDEQLLHLTRYIHLNPVTAYLVNKPEEWPASSYKEYLGKEEICKYSNILDIKAESYKKFVEDQVSYQRELAKIKELVLE